MVVQAGEVGGGPAGGPALRVGDPCGPAAAQGVAEHLVHRVVDCPLARGEERHQRRAARAGYGTGRLPGCGGFAQFPGLPPNGFQPWVAQGPTPAIRSTVMWVM